MFLHTSLLSGQSLSQLSRHEVKSGDMSGRVKALSTCLATHRGIQNDDGLDQEHDSLQRIVFVACIVKRLEDRSMMPLTSHQHLSCIV